MAFILCLTVFKQMLFAHVPLPDAPRRSGMNGLCPASTHPGPLLRRARTGQALGSEQRCARNSEGLGTVHRFLVSAGRFDQPYSGGLVRLAQPCYTGAVEHLYHPRGTRMLKAKKIRLNVSAENATTQEVVR